MNTAGALSVYYDALDASFNEIAESSGPFSPYVRKALRRSGKRIRPIFALLSCEAICGDFSRAIPLAVSYELAHDASLIQDDIMDRSLKRRYRKSVYSEFGLNTAILTSDALIFEIFTQLGRLKKTGVSKDRLYMLLEIIGQSAKDTAIGEFIDNEMNAHNYESEKKYLEMVKNKTGALIAASAACGGIVGGSTKKETEILYRFGLDAGIAYQINDDIIDLMGEEDTIGKTIFSDVRNRKKNIVLIHALQNGSPEEQTFFRGLFGKSWFLEEEIARGREILNRVGSIDHAKRLALQVVEEGKKELLKLRNTPSRQKLIDFWYSLSRFASDSEGPIVNSTEMLMRNSSPDELNELRVF